MNSHNLLTLEIEGEVERVDCPSVAGISLDGDSISTISKPNKSSV